MNDNPTNEAVAGAGAAPRAAASSGAAADSSTDRRHRRRVVGIVTSTKMQKTIVVESERTVQHPVFKKYLRRATAYKAHDEKGEAEVGDRVELMETRPISRTKFFRLVRIIKKARIPAATPELKLEEELEAGSAPKARSKPAVPGEEA